MLLPPLRFLDEPLQCITMPLAFPSLLSNRGRQAAASGTVSKACYCATRPTLRGLCARPPGKKSACMRYGHCRENDSMA